MVNVVVTSWWRMIGDRATTFKVPETWKIGKVDGFESRKCKLFSENNCLIRIKVREVAEFSFVCVGCSFRALSKAQSTH
jgi:hypothetical protein